MARSVVRWSGKKVRFDAESESGHPAAMDEPPVYGEDSAMRPTEMLLSALGGCTGVNAVLLLKKFKQPLKALEIEVLGEQDKEWPRAFNKIEVVFHCTWDGDIDRKAVEEALDMACHRYCPIHATLSAGTKVVHRRTDDR